MGKNKSKKTHTIKGAKSLIVKKYPFDRDNEESYTATPEEIFILRKSPRLDKFSPSQFWYDRMLQRLREAGCESIDFRRYTFSEVVQAIRQCFEDGLKDLVSSWELDYAKLRQEWQADFVWTTQLDVLMYWHKREKKAVKKIESHRPLERHKKLWPFFEGHKQVFHPDRDLDYIFLAVGIKLDQLFSTNIFITGDMWSVILEKTKSYINRAFASSEINLRYSFGPHFEGQTMTYETVAVLWEFCKADLQHHGFKYGLDQTHAKKQWPPAGYTARKDIREKWNKPETTVDTWAKKDRKELEEIEDIIRHKRSNQIAYKDKWIKEHIEESK